MAPAKRAAASRGKRKAAPKLATARVAAVKRGRPPAASRGKRKCAAPSKRGARGS